MRNGRGCRHVTDIGKTFKFIARLVALKTVERLFNFVNPSTMGLLIYFFFSKLGNCVVRGLE